MQIIYGFSNCTDRLYDQIANENNLAVLRPDQKYHGLLIKGLAENGANVRCLSGLPVNRAVTSRKWISYPDETEGNAHYHYYKTLNLPLFRQFMIFFGAFVNTLKIKRTSETYAICDCLNIANAYGMALACKFRKIPIITIVTDLPDMESNNVLLQRINNTVFKIVDGFVFLTEQMNVRINRKKCPYIVLEGHVDSKAPVKNIGESYEKTDGRKVILYAGSLLKLYGIQNLVEGFLKADIENTELHIYGNGDYREELTELSKKHENVKYYGVRSNMEIVKDELKAALLVNPRPIAPEYTKYSFPSKNMEYMVSGTPLLTTVLPGMPKEYYPYVYLLEDESADGVANRLKEIFSLSMEERQAKGLSAREFVMREKSNMKQSRHIMDFLIKEWGIK